MVCGPLPAGVDGKGVRDLVKKWLMSFCEIGGLMKRLDIGEGNYTKELEEDIDVYDAINQVSTYLTCGKVCSLDLVPKPASCEMIVRATQQHPPWCTF